MIFCCEAGDYLRAVSTAVIMNDSSFVCRESFDDTRAFFASAKNLEDVTSANTPPVPIIYFVTPTYPRREQVPELIRLGQTLMHVPHLHWIVADDTDSCNSYLDTLLNRFGE